MLEIKKELEDLNGSLLMIGALDGKIVDILDKNSNIAPTFYLNCNNKGSKAEVTTIDVANNIGLEELHKYFKDGVDYITCEYNAIKDYIPSFIRESLRITRKNIYIFLKIKMIINIY